MIYIILQFILYSIFFYICLLFLRRYLCEHYDLELGSRASLKFNGFILYRKCYDCGKKIEEKCSICKKVILHNGICSDKYCREGCPNSSKTFNNIPKEFSYKYVCMAKCIDKCASPGIKPHFPIPPIDDFRKSGF